MALPDYSNEFLLFVYSKKHDKTPRLENKFRYEIADKLPEFRGRKYTAAIIVGKQFNPATAEYFEIFDDAVVLGIGTIQGCKRG